MKLLLDTHAWLWFHLGDARLSQTARQHIEDPANDKFISPASFGEISIKISFKKYTLSIPCAQFMNDAITGQGFKVLSIKPSHTEVMTTLEVPMIAGKEHPDPFDRLLISEAKSEGMSIVSGVSMFTAYADVPIIW